MEDKKEVEFVDGLFVKEPHERAPDFVKASISIKRAELGNWLRGKDDEWVNIVVKEAQSGKWYCQVDNWKPEPQAGQAQAPAKTAFVDDKLEDLPF